MYRYHLVLLSCVTKQLFLDSYVEWSKYLLCLNNITFKPIGVCAIIPSKNQTHRDKFNRQRVKKWVDRCFGVE